MSTVLERLPRWRLDRSTTSTSYSPDQHVKARSTSFTTRRLNASTFLIIEDDEYGEQPHIYVKVYATALLVTDTGCDAPRRKPVAMPHLREYLESHLVPCNDGRALNPHGDKDYLVLCSHCHYDHIGGIEHFRTPRCTIIASAFAPDFILRDLPRHSICKYMDIPTPEYEVGHWARHMEYLNHKGTPLRVQLLQIPGHTPDSLAWYDIDEHHLYVGDTFYERTRTIATPDNLPESSRAHELPRIQQAIIFPAEGDWSDFMASLDVLLSFVRHQNEILRRQHDAEFATADGAERSAKKGAPPRVLVACGHMTAGADGEEIVVAVRALFERIIAGKVPVRETTYIRGDVYDTWDEGEEARFAVRGPRRLLEEVRRTREGCPH